MFFFKSRSHTRMLHTYTPNQCAYQFSTSYTLWFLRYSPDKIFKLMVTAVRSIGKSRSNHDIAHLHPQPMSLTSFNLLHLIVSSGKTFSHCHPAHPDTMGKNNTHTTLKGCGVTNKKVISRNMSLTRAHT